MLGGQSQVQAQAQAQAQSHTQLPAIPCTNCGMEGHTYKSCILPVNSYGVIAFRFRDQWTSRVKTYTEMVAKMYDRMPRNTLASPDEYSELEFLLIRRKDSLRFVDFVRGKYDIRDEVYLTQMLSNMTGAEREAIRASTFDELWRSVWGTTHVRSYKGDYDVSKTRFEELRATGLLDRILCRTTSRWETPEWGFPKGRRNPRESDYDCAVREFKEETGLRDADFKVITNMQPLCETFCADNNVHYCHKYYLAFCDVAADPKMEDYPQQEREIGDIRWMSANEALRLIRDENIEKREMLLHVCSILRNYFIGGSGSAAAHAHARGGEKSEEGYKYGAVLHRPGIIGSMGRGD
jgi:8-oxo-dGTP pyrophosphatase MutT (NUDIX family)